MATGTKAKSKATKKTVVATKAAKKTAPTAKSTQKEQEPNMDSTKEVETVATQEEENEATNESEAHLTVEDLFSKPEFQNLSYAERIAMLEEGIKQIKQEKKQEEKCLKCWVWNEETSTAEQGHELREGDKVVALYLFQDNVTGTLSWDQPEGDFTQLINVWNGTPMTVEKLGRKLVILTEEKDGIVYKVRRKARPEALITLDSNEKLQKHLEAQQAELTIEENDILWIELKSAIQSQDMEKIAGVVKGMVDRDVAEMTNFTSWADIPESVEA